MNVFVLCTGRCGSTTFAKACAPITNWTAAHESRTHLTGARRFNYPDRHIEVDNRLSWLLGRLERTYGDTAFYVHLIRDPEETARSFLSRADKGILLAYRTEILMRAPRRNADLPTIRFCRDYVDTVTANIESFLKDKTRKMTVHLGTVKDDFARFLDAIGAEGDLAGAIAGWDEVHNPTKPKSA
jgi:hypothetical protein